MQIEGAGFCFLYSGIIVKKLQGQKKDLSEVIGNLERVLAILYSKLKLFSN